MQKASPFLIVDVSFFDCRALRSAFSYPTIQVLH